MNGEELLELIGDVSAEYIENADRFPKKKNNLIRIIIPAAAAVCIFSLSALGFMNGSYGRMKSEAAIANDPAEILEDEEADAMYDITSDSAYDHSGSEFADSKEQPSSHNTIISEWPDNNAIYCYASPADGTAVVSVPLSSVMEEYGEDFLYWVKLQLFSDHEPIDLYKCYESEEIQRLINEEGFIVEEIDGTVFLTGIISYEHLNNFDCSSIYGYFFYLLNGDY